MHYRGGAVQRLPCPWCARTEVFSMPQPSTVTPLADPGALGTPYGPGPFSTPNPRPISTAQIGNTTAGTSISGSSIAGGTVVLGLTNDNGVARRQLFVKSTCNQAVHLVVQLVAPSDPNGTTPVSGTIAVLDLAFAAGNTNPQTAVITSAGAAT